LETGSAKAGFSDPERSGAFTLCDHPPHSLDNEDAQRRALAAIFLASSSSESGISTVIFLLYVSHKACEHQVYGMPVPAAGSADLSWMRQAKLARPIDLGTAKTAGITIPQRLLLRADEVIQ
jgi:hypothetical protein